MAKSIRDIFLATTECFRRAGIEDPRIEAEVLLQHALGVSKTRLFALLKEPFPAAAQARLDEYVSRRLRREPSAYIVGHREFYGLDLAVSPAVLIPRPETELLVESVIELAESRRRTGEEVRIADIGTGSGAIALALASRLPDAVIVATDVSAAALDVAARNAARLGLDKRVGFVRCDLLQGLARRQFAIVAANLPYVALDAIDSLAPEIVRFEPHGALFAGDQGLDTLARFLATVPGHLIAGGHVVTEIGEGQARSVRSLIHTLMPGAQCEVRQDLAGRDRVVIAGIPA